MKDAAAKQYEKIKVYCAYYPSEMTIDDASQENIIKPEKMTAEKEDFNDPSFMD